MQRLILDRRLRRAVGKFRGGHKYSRKPPGAHQLGPHLRIVIAMNVPFGLHPCASWSASAGP